MGAVGTTSGFPDFSWLHHPDPDPDGAVREETPRGTVGDSQRGQTYGERAWGAPERADPPGGFRAADLDVPAAAEGVQPAPALVAEPGLVFP